MYFNVSICQLVFCWLESQFCWCSWTSLVFTFQSNLQNKTTGKKVLSVTYHSITYVCYMTRFRRWLSPVCVQTLHLVILRAHQFTKRPISINECSENMAVVQVIYRRNILLNMCWIFWQNCKCLYCNAILYREGKSCLPLQQHWKANVVLEVILLQKC